MGVINRIGRIQDGTTVSDYDRSEIERQMSLKIGVLNGDWNNTHLNVLDTPGYADFIAESKSALRVCDLALVVIDGVSGVEIGTERVWSFASEYELPRMILINKMDRSDAEPQTIVDVAKERFGRQVVPVQIPVNPGEGFDQIIDLINMRLIKYDEGQGTPSDIPAEMEDEALEKHSELVEAIAETDEELMEKYFSDGELSAEDIESGLKKAVRNLELIPVLFSDAYNGVGVSELLDVIVQYVPSPVHSVGLTFSTEDGEKTTLEPKPEAPLASLVFKVIAEQHVGELTMLRLFSGKISPGMEVFNVNKNQTERIGQLYRLNGHNRDEVTEAIAGDIVALVKLRHTHTNDTLTVRNAPVSLPPIEFPEPLIAVSIEPKEKGGEDRMATGLSQLREEDPSLVFKYDPEISQSVLIAQGELHLGTILERLKTRFGAEVVTAQLRIPYQETIRGNAEGHHRHKKQTGGRGQFGEVYLRVEARQRGEGFEFANQVVGGNIPSNFIPAVEKGIVETLDRGPLAGYKVVDVAATVYDGKHHPVDSDEVSFKLAASQAFREAFLKASPILLEPIYSVTVTVPEEYMGDVMGDLSSRRGRINGMDTDGHFQIIRAEVPLAELDRYSTTLRSMTQGRGMHLQEFLRYEDVPGDIQHKIVEEAKKAQDED